MLLKGLTFNGDLIKVGRELRFIVKKIFSVMKIVSRLLLGFVGDGVFKGKSMY